jgi:hypothetical protein
VGIVAVAVVAGVIVWPIVRGRRRDRAEAV